MLLENGEILIGEHTPDDHPTVTGQGFGARGLVERDPVLHPQGYCASIPPAQIQTYADDVLRRMIADMEAAKARISDRMRRSPGGLYASYYQNGQGYCWYYGMIGAVSAKRAVQGQPHVPLSGHAGACMIMKFRDQGGWGALALQDALVRGIATQAKWPQGSMSQKYNTAETWEDAKNNMPGETFADLASPHYGRKMAWDQECACLVDLNPTICDYNWQGHCTFSVDLVDGASQRTVTRDPDSGKTLDLTTFDKAWGMNNPVTGGIGKRCRNSYADTFGDKGFYVLTGDKARSSNAVAIITASA